MKSFWKPSTFPRVQALVFFLAFLAADVAHAQIPGISLPAGGQAQGKTPSKKLVAAKEIKIHNDVSDEELRAFLGKFLPRHPGARHVHVEVDDGVVILTGRVVDDETRGQITEDIQRIDGVRLVLNHLQTDEEIMGAPEYALKEADSAAHRLARKWLLILIAVMVFVLSVSVAKFVNAKSEYLLAPFFRNPLLRSIAGSFLSSFLVIGGILAALWLLNLTHIVLSILGLAGVVGLAVGFAFRDITENFIASILLGMRRPFQIGDYIKVAGQAGIVKSLNTRATILVTLEGSQVRIPNTIIFKEILVNSSATPYARNGFDLLIPYEVSTVAALDAIAAALKLQEGVLADPPPRVFVDALEQAGVRLRTIYWIPTSGIDGDQLASDAKLKVKVALQRIGVTPPSPTREVVLRVADPSPLALADEHVERPQSDSKPNAKPDSKPESNSPASLTSGEISAADLRRDARGSNNSVTMPDMPAPIEEALAAHRNHFGEGSENLLENGRDKKE